VTARSIDHGELVSKDDDLQVQQCPGPNEKAQRMLADGSVERLASTPQRLKLTMP